MKLELEVKSATVIEKIQSDEIILVVKAINLPLEETFTISIPTTYQTGGSWIKHFLCMEPQYKIIY